MSSPNAYCIFMIFFPKNIFWKRITKRKESNNMKQFSIWLWHFISFHFILFGIFYGHFWVLFLFRFKKTLKSTYLCNFMAYICIYMKKKVPKTKVLLLPSTTWKTAIAFDADIVCHLLMLHRKWQVNTPGDPCWNSYP